jgi:hypothetical protein
MPKGSSTWRYKVPHIEVENIGTPAARDASTRPRWFILCGTPQDERAGSASATPFQVI